MKSPEEGANDKEREHGRFPGWAPWGSGKPQPQTRGPAQHCVTSAQREKVLVSLAGAPAGLSPDKPLFWTSFLELQLHGRNELGNSGGLKGEVASKL